MPPKGKLPDNVIADFEAWVKMGAPDPRDGKSAEAKKYVVDVEKGASSGVQRAHSGRNPQNQERDDQPD